MFKELFKKKEDQPNKKRQIENIVVFIIILIITVLIINNMWSTDNKKEKNNSTDTTKVLAKDISEDSMQNSEKNLEDKLEDILESIDGVGKAKVLIKYSQTSTVVAMYNETNSESNIQEEGGDGATKNTKESETKKEIVYSDEGGVNKPITEKVIMPIIEGAIITAQGASNANIKSSIVSAVQAITGLPVHKIQVFEMKGN